VGLRAGPGASCLGASGRTDLWVRPWGVTEEGHGGGRRLFVALLVLGIRLPGRSRSARGGRCGSGNTGAPARGPALSGLCDERQENFVDHLRDVLFCQVAGLEYQALYH